MQSVVFLSLVACLWTTGALALVDECESTNTTAMKFTIMSRMNRTGHWIYQVDLQHDKREGLRPWTVEVQQSQLTCNGVDQMRTTTTITAPAARAGPAYELHAGVGYYKLHMEKKTWSVAKGICVVEGAHLAIVNSEQELKVLETMFARFPDIGVWAFVGFHDLYTEGQFVTIFDEPLSATGFTRWCPTQPDNAGGIEDCGTILRNCGLNDCPCDTPGPFFCEQGLE